MSSKLVDNKRRHHVDKVLREISKSPQSSARPQEKADTSSENESAFMSSRKALSEQYSVIRQDLMKLKNDLFKGMDLARELMDRRNIMELFRSRI